MSSLEKRWIIAGWSATDIPTQNGRTAIVTGTGGLGYEVSAALARAGAKTILAGRNPAKGAESVARIREVHAAADIRFERLDLASLTSIAAFAARMQNERIDLLINNAGVMMPPAREVTADGFELQYGTNFLGHFALTMRLIPQLRAGHEARVVTVSSLGANDGTIDFDDMQSERGYRPLAAYNQSKLADLLFAFEFERRSRAAACDIAGIAAHPGVARTEIIPNGTGADSVMSRVARIIGPFVMQSAARGALSILFAATSPDAKGGGYYGPGGLGGMRGAPVPVKPPAAALDRHAAARPVDFRARVDGRDLREFHADMKCVRRG